jgi:hypothetical protein
MVSAVSASRSRTASGGWAALALLVAVALTSAAGPASGAKTRPKISAPKITIQLVSPAVGTVVPRYGGSPMFHWTIATMGLAPLHGSGRLEVSTSPTFDQMATARFDCGYSQGDCMTRFQWNNGSPHWYDLANSCADVPPVGDCSSPSRVLYWRVRYQPVGGRSYTSPTWMLRRATSPDTVAPVANADPGSAPYGQLARVTYSVDDGGGATRFVAELYDGSTVVFGARTDWNPARGFYKSFWDLPLPADVGPGTYRWCFTVSDLADNSDTDCAPYTITSS